MQQHIAALHQLAGIATQCFADEQTLAQAASIIRQATGAAEAMVVYAKDKNFLTCSDAGDDPPTELTLAALAWVQRHAAQTSEPVAFNLRSSALRALVKSPTRRPTRLKATGSLVWAA